MKLTETTACVELGLSAPSTAEEVRKKYKTLARKLHPDLGGDEERFKQVSAAYTFLMNLYEQDTSTRRNKRDKNRNRTHQSKTKTQDQTHDHQQAWQAWRQQSHQYKKTESSTQNPKSSKTTKQTKANTTHTDAHTQTPHASVQKVQANVVHTWRDHLNSFGKETAENIKVKSKEIGKKLNIWYRQTASGLYERGKDEELKLSIDIQTLLYGKQQRIAINRQVACPTCQSTITDQSEKESSALYKASECVTCQGEARISQREELSVYIPPGADQGHKLKVKGKGRASLNQSPDGDLYLLLNPPSLPVGFTRKGADLYLQLRVPHLKLQQGGQISFDSPFGPLSIEIPSKFTSGRKLKVTEKGLTHWGNEETRGDLWITVHAQS